MKQSNLPRNKAIATAVIKGATLKKTAEKHNLSGEQVRRIVFNIMRVGCIKRYGSPYTMMYVTLKDIRRNVTWSLALIRNL